MPDDLRRREEVFPDDAPAGYPKPKDKPQPLALEQFNGVVGRASLYIPTKLTNPNNKPVALSFKSTPVAVEH